MSPVNIYSEIHRRDSRPTNDRPVLRFWSPRRAGTLDDWQIFPYLLGQAGSGKSLIVEHAVGNIYQHSDRGTLSSNIEKRFGLSALLGKLIILGPEISKDSQFEQTELQSMASGEFLKVNVKCKTGRDVRWTAPLFLAGNETPSWKDNAGSLTRCVRAARRCGGVARNQKLANSKVATTERNAGASSPCLSESP